RWSSIRECYPLSKSVLQNHADAHANWGFTRTLTETRNLNKVQRWGGMLSLIPGFVAFASK
ncbi:hypothetical protein, partial [Paenibacillus sp. SI8]|uniref:hypothetical protein n=1 Tax=unclassified Paenibacillus TaxID=185978 RepID=UPI00346622B9